VKVRYPGYVFCKIRLTEDVYEKLQELELTRSWMGTINRKGYKKLPTVPLPLNEEEVAKFKGLEEQAEMFEDMFGGDYTGRHDSGEDLLAQYAGYEPGQMVKILKGNFEGEDGTVRRLKDGQLMVRMFTYGQTFDNWFDPDAIRPLTDLEVMRGMSGPDKPITQDQFDVGIGKKDASILQDNFEETRDGKSTLLQSSGAGPTRNRKQDRIARGETGKDLFGRTPEEIKQEEANWLAYREEKRATQRVESAVTDSPAIKTKKKEDGPKKGHDTWGIVERSSWDGGEFGFDNFVEEERAAQRRLEEMYQDRGEFRSYDRNQRGNRNTVDTRGPRQGRDFSADSKQRFNRDDSNRGSRSDFGDRQQATRDQRRPVREPPNKIFRDGDKFDRSRRVKELDWASKSQAVNNNDSDDFFSNLMKELKDDVDSSSQRGRGTRRHDNAGANERTQTNSNEDSFFENLMSELGSSLEEPQSQSSRRSSDAGDDNDFFANLESELSSSLNNEAQPTSSSDAENDDDAFFASLQSELDASLNGVTNKGGKKENTEFSDDDFFASLQQEMDSTLNKVPEKDDTPFEDNFFSGLMDDVADEVEKTESKKSGGVKVVNAPKESPGDLNSMTGEFANVMDVSWI